MTNSASNLEFMDAFTFVDRRWVRDGTWSLIAWGASLLFIQYLLGVRMAPTAWESSLLLLWFIVGAAIALVLARRVCRWPAGYAEFHRMLKQMEEHPFSLELHWRFFKLSMRYGYVTHKRDTAAIFALLFATISIVYVASGAIAVEAGLLLFLGLNVAWGGVKRRYLLPRLEAARRACS